MYRNRFIAHRGLNESTSYLNPHVLWLENQGHVLETGYTGEEMEKNLLHRKDPKGKYTQSTFTSLCDSRPFKHRKVVIQHSLFIGILTQRDHS